MNLGQTILFAVETSGDQKFTGTILLPVHKGDTALKIALRRGHLEEARTIADLNDLRSVRTVIKKHQVRVPAELRAANVLEVLAGDEPPRITAGYAKFDTLDRPGRVGLTHFTGYDPVVMEVPIRFESWIDNNGVSVEAGIFKLEKMAGRGNFEGAATGPPPIIRVSSVDGSNVVPLIPTNYQLTEKNQTAPVWRIAGIDWDAAPLRNVHGNRTRQLATVTLQQHVAMGTITRSAAQRAKAKKKSKATKAKAKGK